MYVEIGGIDQWIQIGGQAPDHPTLLYLHGGPGGPQYRRPPLGSRGRITSPSCTGINVEPAGRFARMAKRAAVD